MKILFIAHDASRTGAPVVLLNLLRWIKKNSEIKFDILLLKDGPLRNDFENLTTTYFVPYDYKYSFINKFRRRLHPELSDEYKLAEVVEKLTKNNYSIIYGNTIVTLPWLLQFKKSSNVRVVCAMHELSYIIEFYFKKEYVLQELRKIDLVIAGSHAVENNLLNEFNFPKEKVVVVHAFIDTNFLINKSRETLKAELGIKNNELVIGAMGSIDLRKGLDLISPLAMALKDKFPEVSYKIVWVGGLATDSLIKLFKQDAVKCRVDDKIIFIENTPHPEDYINLYDIFILLSREDPFPLVLLTAAAMEKAVIAFDKSGGAPELLSDGAGFIIPYLDINAMAEKISDLYHNREMIYETGKKARQKVEQEFSSNVIPEKVLKILNDL